MKEVYGIDLCTTYSAISHISDTGNKKIINTPDGGTITISAVFFEAVLRWEKEQRIRLH